ncbi:MAG: hypothetical protein J7L04_03450 [Bacteroidales bacterium]|nr:hypothetical protein [Bacteroidales bacterium]
MKPNVFIVFMALLLIGCEKSSDIEFSLPAPEGLVHWDVVRVEGLNTVNVNQIISLDVYYSTSSGCDYVSEFVSDRYDNRILIKAYGNTIVDSPCTLAAVPKKINYDFITDKKGTFTFEFINRDESVIKHYVIVK